MSDGRWHNVTVRRVGNEATLEVTSDGDVLVGRVSGSKGTHRLLDTSGVLYVGANLYVVNGEIRVIDNFEGELNSVFFFWIKITHTRCLVLLYLFGYRIYLKLKRIQV